MLAAYAWRATGPTKDLIHRLALEVPVSADDDRSEEAKLPKLRGGLWHPYRRKWATERKHLPIRDVAAAGGWNDTETLLTCYQQPDGKTLLAVMSESTKVRDEAVG